MSYCRWSSCDWWSDVYVYADVCGGFTTHVAGMRYQFTEPLPPEGPTIDGDDFDAWWERYQTVTRMVSEATLVSIDLPHDGAYFNDPTAAECADRLESLRAVGYHVPQFAVDALRGKAADPVGESTP